MNSVIKKDLSAFNKFGSATRLTQGNLFVCPSDGYIRIDCSGNASNTAIVDIFSADNANSFRVGHIGGNSYAVTALFVKKGMTVRATTLSNGGAVFFIPCF